MPERRDYLPVCNDHGVPLPDFQAMFCIRCVQPECSRSRTGGLFETRVTTWEETLFKNPVRMGKEDPLYATIAAKRFIEIDTGRVPEVGGSWLDPRVLEEPAAPVVKPRAAKPPPVREKPEPASPAATKPATPTAPRAPLNSTFSQGAMLSESPAPASQKPVDPWAAPAPPSASESTVPVVKVGAQIRFK